MQACDHVASRCEPAHLFQKLAADQLSPFDTELQRAAGVAQVSSVQHQLQQHVTVPPGSQIRLLRAALTEGVQQPHVLGHVRCQHCIHYQPPSLHRKVSAVGCCKVADP